MPRLTISTLLCGHKLWMHLYFFCGVSVLQLMGKLVKRDLRSGGQTKQKQTNGPVDWGGDCREREREGYGRGK